MTIHIYSPREALYIQDQIYIQENVKNYIHSRKFQIYIQEFLQIYIQESFKAEQYTFIFFQNCSHWSFVTDLAFEHSNIHSTMIELYYFLTGPALDFGIT